MDWSACASKEQLQAARDEKLKLQFFDRDVLKEWLNYIKGKKVLCLAGAGGLIECGFLINGYVECQMDDITELHFMTRAIKN